jgi:hypothetical protein
MIAYTAWDSLQVMARDYGADLALGPDERITLAPRKERSGALPTLRSLYHRVRAGRA